ncbi:hypothetical protein [Acidicapsa ligni]|uniref:hypothetical protein n=1 Tax=Acidicapsa ligni TaxID=542300 RepID=UPI0021E0F8D3|nr:hypothetical protein [Acidicapsa ligni]
MRTEKEDSMKVETIFKKSRKSSAAFVLALLVGVSCVASAAADNKKAAPAPKAAPKAAPARPAAGAKPATAGAAHGAAGGAASHGATAGGTAHGPTANGASHGPTANGGGASRAGATTAGHAEGAGARAGGGSTSTPRGTTASKSAIHSPVPRGTSEHTTRSGNAVRTRADGRVSDVHDARRGMDIHHGLDGGRRVSMDRPGHGRLYAERGRRGYVQRGYGYHGHDFGRRSYYYHGREYDRYYRGYGYRGVYLNVYAPGYYYGPGFYGWAYNPWAAPIAFGWGWAGSPWLGFYGGYFSPYAVYPSAAFWLTDYIISQDLQAAYAARQDAAVAAGEAEAAGGPPALSPDVKQMIADEVKGQLALENSEAQQAGQKQDVDPASSGIARLLADGHSHVFVVGGGLDLTDSTGQECAVSEGDALQLAAPPPADATSADLVVLASKGGKECARTSTVSVALTDLQEMQNHMRETIDQGLQDLQAKQGKGGLPQAPPSAQAKPTQTEYAAIAPPPDPKDAADIQAETKEADQAETDVAKEAGQENGSPIGSVASPAPTASVALGQTPDQVKAILGNPTKTADLGAKQIYYYDGMKVIFKSGKVSDVE